VVYRRRVFAKENWRLLLQVFVIVMVTIACTLAGPIAKVSLRKVLTVQSDMIGVTHTSKGDSFLGVRINGDVDWNETMRSLDQADFPYNQLLDYLPVATAPWTYIAREWVPTWKAECAFHNEIILRNLTATGNGTFIQPLDAFPAYKDTFDSSWLNSSRFRMQSHFNGETIFTPDQGMVYKDALFWTIIQSDPGINDRMYTNNETLRLSISALHTKNLATSPLDDFTQASSDTWQPIGVAENASFSRTECVITRTSQVLDEEIIPWLWTNDTFSIAFAYKTYWMTILGKNSAKNLSVTAPTPEEIFRFYQAYMFSVNSWLSPSSHQYVSVWMPTVQLSTILLVLVVILVVLIVSVTIRYFWFLRRYKQELERMGIPDGRLEWMVHAARLAAQEEEQMREQKVKDREYLRRSSFGKVTERSDRPFGLARVHTSRNITRGDRSSPRSKNAVRSGNSMPQHHGIFGRVRRHTQDPPTIEQMEQEEAHAKPLGGIDIRVLDDDGITQLEPQIDDDASHVEGVSLKPTISWKSSLTRSRSIDSNISSPGTTIRVESCGASGIEPRATTPDEESRDFPDVRSASGDAAT
jgi:hypothetical protein